jgi:hypothetical protein
LSHKYIVSILYQYYNKKLKQWNDEAAFIPHLKEGAFGYVAVIEEFNGFKDFS